MSSGISVKVVLLHAYHYFDGNTLLGGVKSLLHLAQREAVGDERLHVHPAGRHQGQGRRVAARASRPRKTISVIHRLADSTEFSFQVCIALKK